MHKCFSKKWNVFVYAFAKEKLNALFLANAKSNFGAIFGYFMKFFVFSGKIVAFPMQISSGKLVICYTKWDSVFSHSKRIYIFTVIPKIC